MSSISLWTPNNHLVVNFDLIFNPIIIDLRIHLFNENPLFSPLPTKRRWARVFVWTAPPFKHNSTLEWRNKWEKKNRDDQLINNKWTLKTHTHTHKHLNRHQQKCLTINFDSNGTVRSPEKIVDCSTKINNTHFSNAP